MRRRELLVRDGYEKLSMRRVRRADDYSPTAIYLHFKDKQELVSKPVRRNVSRALGPRVGDAAHEFADPIVRLRKGLERYIASPQSTPTITCDVRPAAPGHDGRRQKQKAADSNGMRCFGCPPRLHRDGVKSRKLRKVDPEAAARAAWAGIHGN